MNSWFLAVAVSLSCMRREGHYVRLENKRFVRLDWIGVLAYFHEWYRDPMREKYPRLL